MFTELEEKRGSSGLPARVRCAILPWTAVLAAVERKAEPVTTESEKA